VTLLTLVAVALGGALGAVLRYLVSGWIQDASGSFFPGGTFGVNLAGSLALGFAMVWLQGTVASAEARALVTIGFLGSFTTFSTFSFETTAMLRDGEWWRASAYALGSLALGLVAIAAGAALAASVLRARSG
jgi:CrcB protein